MADKKYYEDAIKTLAQYGRREFATVMGHDPDPSDDRPFMVIVKALEAVANGDGAELRRLAEVAQSYMPKAAP
jgi:hypothetical protein